MVIGVNGVTIKTAATQMSSTIATPFDLANDTLYGEWRDEKLKDYPTATADLLVELDDPRTVTSSEYDALLQRCRKTNMVLYASGTGDDPDPEIPLALGRSFGLHDLDRNWLGDDSGLTSLTVQGEGTRQFYIPYTDRPIKWHTDGYYNTADHQIHGLMLHCVQRAVEGGENALLDHEIAYILLREKNPDYIRALMAPDVMTIPCRTEQGELARAEETGPVFSITSEGELHMRFTERKRNIVWKEDPLTLEAVAYLQELLAGDSPYIFRGRLEPGMGLISNNILHDRAAFSDDSAHKRLLYRARYYDRIERTGFRCLLGR
jgi:Taurine catabolism dioxygenase TauD, TfdA family